ncbi:hypothetical protein [Novosphingobium sp.]|uniref:hypothetical protein n=1 Tax=Novosphingobium sp. TaxID=1874826 RepID=UPI0035ADEAD2
MRQYRGVAGGALALLTLAVGPAASATNYGIYLGACRQPDAPYYRGPSKPSKPSCAVMRNCPDWEVSEYRNKSQVFPSAMRRYASDVQAFNEQAAEFVRCMTED